ncbi:MAG TPA: beta-ketoacyl-[acyl-carrier-protein] synthase family protein [Planctomycetota bacterium]|nr:beta-ketoacyl-[acyl-carrier-protein] synthase family protein [Planctomycetota bacterium]
MRRVAITGFGVVSPVGVGRAAFWDALRRGQSGIARITRFDCTTFAAHLAGEVKAMPALPERVAAVAAEDPKVGFAFAACTEALADAGVERLDADTLLHLGATLEILDPVKLIHNGRPDLRATILAYFRGEISGSQLPLDTATALVCEAFGRPRQALTNCSACAVGAQAIGHGFRSVRAGRFEAAICGGSDSLVNAHGIGGLQLLGALTTDNERGAHACRPFDAARRGTVLGEGAAVVVLEPLEKARAEGKRLLAEVCGYGSSMDAHSLSAPDPDGDGAARAMRAALDDAGLRPGQIAHINTHGTGTWLNDEVEAKAIRRVFDGAWERIPVSSTKSMTGHMIAAAGAVEVGACLLALLQGVMPPNPCLDKVAPRCELNHVTGQAAPFEGEYALTNSFAFGGQNATLVLRKADD